MKSRLQGKNPEVLRGSEDWKAKQGEVRRRTHKALLEAKLVVLWRAIKPEPLGLSCLPDDLFACPLDKARQVPVASAWVSVNRTH